MSAIDNTVDSLRETFRRDQVWPFLAPAQKTGQRG